ncbi:hypothetical protein DF037_19075 [Burkholderia contaminans]|uniref:Uncharacterized protein n=1 Tax=Burkholderia contaminans TaxID=488447 RepID=A0A3N8QSD6_9BURK|nr:hypothetical protein [Burkholderia contaminans]RQT26678.1 hypothetical protein DF037_19075 [Burkholderia contaminans]
MTFNTDMPFQEPTVMSVDLVCECPPDDTSCAPADRRAPKRRAERVVRTESTEGRGRRFRFGDAVDAMSAPNDAPPRPVTGSIAISFAVVSRRNWPR